MDIASMLEVEVQEVAEADTADSKENVTPKPQRHYPCQIFSKEENEFYKSTYGNDPASVRFLRLHCTTCDEHIGSAPSESHNMHEHPVLRVILCAKCREFYGDGTFEQGDDNTDMFCRWCANGGNLYCCSYCSNTFCSKCIKRNFDPQTIKRIEAEDSWKCFVCDPKDLYPLRSISRALTTHIDTLKRILENNRRINPREVEEKMHLDETKCCSRKRKRRSRKTFSGSDEDIDDEEDVNYVPEMERGISPGKKRKSRSNTVRNPCNNGYMDHQYNRRATTKLEIDYDPSDLISQCEQTMIEGDGEIVNAIDDTNGVSVNENNQEKTPPVRMPAASPKTSFKVVLKSPQQLEQKLQLQPLQKLQANNSMGTLNPVPIANLLKAMPTFSGGKKIKVTGPPKLVAVPMSSISKSVAASSISFIKPSTHFLVPTKTVNRNLTPIQMQTKVTSMSQIPRLQPIQTKSSSKQPNVIDLDSDDESLNVELNPIITDITPSMHIVNEGYNTEVNISEQCEGNSEDIQVQSGVNKSRTGPRVTLTSLYSRPKVIEKPESTIDDTVPLKAQQRYKRFEKMLQLQSQEIDCAVGELKTKIFKLVQTPIAKPSAMQQDTDLQNAAFVCTKRFHRALRKTLVELSHINDRLVKDFLHWKKRSEVEKSFNDDSLENNVDHQNVDDEQDVEKNVEKNVEKESSRKKKKKIISDIALEMTCERESESEAENDDDDDDDIEISEDREIEAIEVPAEFSSILDHLSIFKRKPTAVKAVGNDSVLTEDKSCQAYDVPWRDYEKCIGYSLLTKSEYDPEKKEEILRSVVQPDENFGKYQEQYYFYLQHVEDYGIETDEAKGLPDPNHIPLKDLIDSSSPFIMDMLERLSPVNLPNGCASLSLNKEVEEDMEEDDVAVVETNESELSNDYFSKDAALDAVTDYIEDTESNNKDSGNNSDTRDEETTSEKKSEEPGVATSKAVEELQKMVMKLSEDLRNEQQQQTTSESTTDEKNNLDMETETLCAVNSILQDVNVNDSCTEADDAMDIVEILDMDTVQKNDDNECSMLD